jgi:hypothetical protein
MFLYKIEAAMSVTQIESLIRHLLTKFFAEIQLPMPTVKIVNAAVPKWLGRCSYTHNVNENRSVIEIQKSIVNDEKTLDRVLCHELIHAVDFYTRYDHPEQGQENWDKYVTHKKLGFKSDGHGQEFQEWAAKINAVMGKDYVAKESDTTYIVELTKVFFLLVMPTSKSSDQYCYAWSFKPSAEQKEVILKKMRDENARLFMSKDERWTHGTKIKKYRALSVPKDEPSKKKLKELYQSGSGIKPNWPAPISKLSDLHKKMINHYGPEMKDILEKDPLGVLGG